jgi:O-antigen ligase
MLMAATGLVAAATISNFINIEQPQVFQFLRFIICGLVTLVVIPLVIRNRQDLLQVGIVVLAIAAASAAVALIQQVPGAPTIASVPNGTVPLGLEFWAGRSLGLGENPIYLTNDLMLVLFPLVGILLIGTNNPRLNRIVMALAVLITAALYFSLTRSWAFSAVGAALGMSFVLKGVVQKYLLLLLMVGALVFWYQAASSESRYNAGADDSGSAASRPVLWSAAMNIALDNPIVGIGYDQFKKESPKYVESIDRGLVQRQNAGGALGKYEPHNDFLDVWSAFGTGALILYLLLFLQSGYNFVLALRSFPDPIMKGIALGCLGALVAFAVNSFFHNLFGSTLTLWVLAGISLALVKVADSEAQEEDEEIWANA